MMNVLSDKEFDIKPISQQQSIIIIDGIDKKQRVDGTYLELCLKQDNFYLVFMTDDTPNEDMLHIHLLNMNLDILDSATIGSMYSTGSFKNYNLDGYKTISFRFLGDTKWSVEILDNPEFLLPYISFPKGVHKNFKLKQYFIIRGYPEPDKIT